MTSALSVQNLSYSIKNKNIIDNLNLTLGIKETCLITGPSGSGKTTLLSLLSGIHAPQGGTVKYNDISLFELSEQERDIFRSSNIAIMFQNFHLIKTLNVIQNINILGALSNTSYDASYGLELLNKLGLGQKKEQKISSLSIREQQRLALVRALAIQPKWLLCDEPTSALDDNNTKIMLDIITEETEKIGASLIIVTHDQRVKQHMHYHHHLEM